MQQESEPDHADGEWHGKDENNGYDTPGDNDDEEDISKWGNRNDEIGDILASQRLVEEHVASQAPGSPKDNGWRDIAERESRPIASPLSELGSPRVVLYTPRKRYHKVWSLLYRPL